MSEIPAEQFGWIHGKDVPAYLAEHQAAFSDTSLWPIALGDPESVGMILEGIEFASEDGVTPERALKEAAALNVQEWLTQHAEDSGIDDPEVIGNGRVRRRKGVGLISHLTVGESRPLAEVGIGLFRVEYSWQVLAHLRWVAANYDITPDVHCAVQDRWRKKYGAEVVSVTGDVIQCRVSRPPTTEIAAMDLAREQFIYCPDIVTQGVGTITELAGSLLDAEYWYFWWD